MSAKHTWPEPWRRWRIWDEKDMINYVCIGPMWVFSHQWKSERVVWTMGVWLIDRRNRCDMCKMPRWRQSEVERLRWGCIVSWLGPIIIHLPTVGWFSDGGGGMREVSVGSNGQCRSTSPIHPLCFHWPAGTDARSINVTLVMTAGQRQCWQCGGKLSVVWTFGVAITVLRLQWILTLDLLLTSESSSIDHRSCFYPRDAVQARALAMALCPSVSVCPSIASRSSVETAERIGLFLAWELLSMHFFKEIRVPLKITVLLSWTLPQNLDLENFASIGAINLARQRWPLRAW